MATGPRPVLLCDICSVPVDGAFCGSCGARRPPQCLACFVAVLERDKFCHQCGVALKRGSLPTATQAGGGGVAPTAPASASTGNCTHDASVLPPPHTTTPAAMAVPATTTTNSAGTGTGTATATVAQRQQTRKASVPEALDEEGVYRTVLESLRAGECVDADFSNLRPRGVRVQFFSLRDVLDAAASCAPLRVLRLSNNSLTSQEVRGLILPFVETCGTVERLFLDGNPGILADVQGALLQAVKARATPVWIETHETGIAPAVRIALKQVDNQDYVNRRKNQELAAVDTDKKWGQQQRQHQGRTVKPYVSLANGRAPGFRG